MAIDRTSSPAAPIQPSARARINLEIAELIKKAKPTEIVDILTGPERLLLSEDNQNQNQNQGRAF